MLALLLGLLVLACGSADPEDPRPVAPSPEPPANDAATDALAGISDPQTLSQLLQWSLKHTDLDDLHRRAEAVRSGQPDPGAAPLAEEPAVLSASGNAGELPEPSRGTADARPPQRMTAERRVELDALAQQLMPNTVELMREALSRALDPSLDVDAREEAMLELEDHAADIDNARDLKSIGGFPSVVELMASGEARLQAAAAWIVGTAVKNHRELQLHLLSLDALRSLLALLLSHSDDEVRAKALYALSAMLRNCPEAQAAFAAADGLGSLLSLLSFESERPKPRLVRKALALVTDLLRESREVAGSGSGTGDSADADQVPLTAAADGQRADDEDEVAAPSAEARAAIGASLAELRASGRNASELCGAVVRCFEMVDDLDSQEKAVQALEQVVAVGLLAPAEQPQGACALENVRAALGRYRSRCAELQSEWERARDRAATPDAEHADDDDRGPCADLLPTAISLDAALGRMQRDV